MDYINLSKEISYALRHNPKEFGLTLDEDGFCNIQDLLDSINKEHKFGRDITKEDLEYIIKNSSKVRHEIKGNKIRALYGHSLNEKIEKEEVVPPSVLYHGTTHDALNNILKNGLVPMKRQYVHLSASIDIANEVGKRRDDQPIILEIDSEKAYKDGIKFYLGNDKIYLSDYISSIYIKVIKE